MTIRPDTAIWLYGSHARGDADELSDFDVLAVSNEPLNISELEGVLGGASAISLTQYTWEEIGSMSEYGSLFLKHLQLEGREILESPSVKGRLSRLLSQLGNYKLAARDLSGFQLVVSDVRESMLCGGSEVFELATLATVIRHASILGNSLSGSYCFSRHEPVRRVVADWNLAVEISSEFPSLYQYRIFADGRTTAPPHSEKLTDYWCGHAGELLGALEGHIFGES